MATYIEQERALRADVTKIVDTDTIKAFRKLELQHTFWDLAFIYLLLFGGVAAAISLHLFLIGPWTLLLTPVLALVSGIAFNWINVQLHEASHYLLLPVKRWNDIYCNLALGAWGLQDVEAYRLTHGMHHAYLHGDRDPDLHIYRQDLGRGRALLSDLLLLSALQRQRQVKAFVHANPCGEHTRTPLYANLAKLVAQLLVLATFMLGCGWWGVLYYGAFWLYGLLAVFPLLVRVRTVVQHYDAAIASKAMSMPYTARSTEASLFEFVLIGARMDYHFEHHLFPTVPHYNLKRMHRALKRHGFFERLPRGRVGLATDDYLLTFATLNPHEAKA